ncbi:MAG: hypothetical protein AB7V18_19555 [Pyrinomonadaceae bacterium]
MGRKNAPDAVPGATRGVPVSMRDRMANQGSRQTSRSRSYTPQMIITTKVTLIRAIMGVPSSP